MVVPQYSTHLALVPVRVLAALARVGLAAHPVHGDGQRRVGLVRDGPEAHRARAEPPDDVLGRLDLVDAHRRRAPVLARPVKVELEQAAERALADRLQRALDEVVVRLPAVPRGRFLNFEIHKMLTIKKITVTTFIKKTSEVSSKKYT